MVVIVTMAGGLEPRQKTSAVEILDVSETETVYNGTQWKGYFLKPYSGGQSCRTLKCPNGPI